MQIVHRISVSFTREVRRELAQFGVIIGAGDPIVSNVVSFEIDESHERWPAIAGWITRRDALDIPDTVFTKSEIDAAEWLELRPSWHWSYPQPEEGYEGQVYEQVDVCEVCGLHGKQKAAFRMKSEPKWGKHGILQLNWVFDQYFVTPEVYRCVCAPLGIQQQPVLNKKGVELETVVQLQVDELVEIAAEGLPSESCEDCQRIKYLPVSVGYFPALKSQPKAHAARTRAWFGSGGSASQLVLVSKRFADALRAEKVRGASFCPVQP